MPRLLLALAVGCTILGTGCVTTTRSPRSNHDVARRIERAFEMEKQRRASLPSTGYAPREPGPDSIAGMRSIVSKEQHRRVALEAEVARLRAGEAEQSRVSAELDRLRTELVNEQERKRALEGEVARLNKRSAEQLTPAEMEAIQAQLAYERQRVATLEAELSRIRRGKESAPVESASEVARLRQRLDQEVRRRLEVEKAFARLREETSVPAFGTGEVSEAELLAVKEELVRTRQALAAERALRESTGIDATGTPAASDTSPDVAAWEERVRTLEAERDELRRQVRRVSDAIANPARNEAPPAP